MSESFTHTAEGEKSCVSGIFVSLSLYQIVYSQNHYVVILISVYFVSMKAIDSSIKGWIG